MKLNGIKKINEAAGRYIVLADYHSEGLSVVEQYEVLSEAVACALAHSGAACSIVQLVEVGEL